MRMKFAHHALYLSDPDRPPRTRCKTSDLGAAGISRGHRQLAQMAVAMVHGAWYLPALQSVHELELFEPVAVTLLPAPQMMH